MQRSDGTFQSWEVAAIDLNTGEMHSFDVYRVCEFGLPEGWTNYDEVDKAMLAARINVLWDEVQALRARSW